jgi:hypothetical protein
MAPPRRSPTKVASGRPTETGSDRPRGQHRRRCAPSTVPCAPSLPLLISYVFFSLPFQSYSNYIVSSQIFILFTDRARAQQRAMRRRPRASGKAGSQPTEARSLSMLPCSPEKITGALRRAAPMPAAAAPAPSRRVQATGRSQPPSRTSARWAARCRVH